MPEMEGSANFRRSAIVHEQHHHLPQLWPLDSTALKERKANKHIFHVGLQNPHTFVPALGYAKGYQAQSLLVLLVEQRLLMMDLPYLDVRQEAPTFLDAAVFFVRSVQL